MIFGFICSFGDLLVRIPESNLTATSLAYQSKETKFPNLGKQYLYPLAPTLPNQHNNFDITLSAY